MLMATTSQENITKKRLTSLDAIRGIASLVVVFCHLRFFISYKTDNFIVNLVTNGDAAVILFFMLSGYVLSRQHYHSYSNFIWRRFCRIYLPFFVAVTLAIFISVPDGPYSIPEHYLMTGTIKGVNLNVVIWSLVYEMRISLIFPLLVLLCRNTRIASLTAFLLVISTARTLVYLNHLSPFSEPYFWVTWIWMLRVIPYFIVGILLEKHAHLISKRLKKLPQWVIIFPLLGLFISHNGYNSIRGDLIYITACSLIIICSINFNKISGFLDKGLFQWLGKVSYSLYLIHFPILSFLFDRSIGPVWLISGLGIAFSLLSATIMHELVEIPAIRLGHRVAQ